MTVRDWFRHTAKYYQSEGIIEGTRYSAKNTWHSILGRIDPHIGGWNIYEDDWDLLIILDACRADLFQEVALQYDWLPDEIEMRRSVGPATRNWMQRTFTDEYSDEIAKTDYIVSNAYSEVLLNPDDFRLLDEVHRYAWDDEYGTVRARPVTERAIDVHRSRNPERQLVHYLPPHFPSIPDYLGYNMHRENFEHADSAEGISWDGVWPAAGAGEVSADRVWEAYRANLEYVLNDIEVLLQNIDADRVIVTSDHGNALGEWWTWGHPPSTYVPVNRRVPYVELEASDEGTLEPELEREAIRGEDGASRDVQDRLKDLGYA